MKSKKYSKRKKINLWDMGFRCITQLQNLKFLNTKTLGVRCGYEIKYEIVSSSICHVSVLNYHFYVFSIGL